MEEACLRSSDCALLMLPCTLLPAQKAPREKTGADTSHPSLVRVLVLDGIAVYIILPAVQLLELYLYRNLYKNDHGSSVLADQQYCLAGISCYSHI